MGSGRLQVGTFRTCQHPDVWVYRPAYDDRGEYLEDYEIKCGWCGKTFASKAAMRRDRKERKNS